MARRLHLAFRWSRHPGGHPTATLRALGLRVLDRLGIGDGEVGILVCDDETIRTLNRHFRNLDAPTDVLSFPSGAAQPEGPPYLGDVAISLETAARQAAVQGHTLQRELEILLVHALLHLCGWDHENDHGEMEELERTLCREFLA